MLAQVIRDPGDALDRDDEIDGCPPETARVVGTKQFARFADADHGPRLIGRETASTLTPAEATGVSSTHGFAH